MRQNTLSVVLVLLAVESTAQVRISQCYGGGGNSGSTWTHDFIELVNAGTSPVDLTGWSVQYASATGSTWQVTPLSGTIQPLHYLLIQEASGGGGTTPLPAPDIIGTISMSATAGKIALVLVSTPLSGTCPLTTDVADFVGFGANANCYEGPGPAPAPSSTTSLTRLGDGAVDTDSNRDDFVAGPPEPRNASSVPLPVQLHSFTAVVATANNVRLEWHTVSEVQNFGFEVQRSAEAFSGFVTLPGGFMPGAGTTLEPQTYAYTDTQVASGIWYYRLRQIDLNGGIHHSHALRVEVSGVSSVTAQTAEEFRLLQNSPNPCNPTTIIRYVLPRGSVVSLAVYDILGREVAVLDRGVRCGGMHAVRFDGHGLAGGVYLYRLLAYPGAPEGGLGAGGTEGFFIGTKKFVLAR